MSDKNYPIGDKFNPMLVAVGVIHSVSFYSSSFTDLTARVLFLSQFGNIIVHVVNVRVCVCVYDFFLRRLLYAVNKSS